MKLTKEQVKMAAHPHLDDGKGGSYFIRSGFVRVPPGIKHGDQIGSFTFRVIERDLYEREYYLAALPIAKELWKEGKL